MVLERSQGAGGGVGVLERLPDLDKREDPKESEEKDLERARSSLTVIENPSLYNRLTILMAKNIIPYNGSKTLLDVYFITAGEGYKVVSPPLKQRGARATTRQVGSQLLYIILDENNGIYPIASLISHEHCRISPEEFQGFEANLSAGKLEGMVNNMVQLIGQRVNMFSLDDGKLVLPPNYASTKLYS